MFSFEYAAWSNFHFAFKSLYYLCLADFTGDSNCLFIETFKIPPTLIMWIFRVCQVDVC